MYFGRVIGTVVCERKCPGLEGKRLVIVQPLNHQGASAGPVEVAVDTVSARAQDLVYLVGSREAALALEPSFVPVDSAIVGLIDSVDA